MHAATIAPPGVAPSQQHILQATSIYVCGQQQGWIEQQAVASLDHITAMSLQLQLHLTADLQTAAGTDPWLDVHVDNRQLVQKGHPAGHIQRQPRAPAARHAMREGHRVDRLSDTSCLLAIALQGCRQGSLAVLRIWWLCWPQLPPACPRGSQAAPAQLRGTQAVLQAAPL